MDLKGDYPSDAGHGNYRINKLLAGTAMVGDSEQYASAMALMARDLGLPSRVVLGSCRKTRMAKSPMPARRRPQAMAPKIEFTGNDVTAWGGNQIAGPGMGGVLSDAQGDQDA